LRGIFYRLHLLDGFAVFGFNIPDDLGHAVVAGVVTREEVVRFLSGIHLTLHKLVLALTCCWLLFWDCV
jgi:hypothetical protein